MQYNKIYNEDCVKFMNNVTSPFADIVLTSPPYNTARNGCDLKTHQGRYESYDDEMTDEDYIDWSVRIFNGFDKILKTNGCVLYNLSYSAENTTLMYLCVSDIIRRTPFTLADTIIWKKKTALPNNHSSNKLTRICEFIFVLCRKSEFSSFRCNKDISSVRDTGQIDYCNIYNFIEAPNNDENCEIHKATFSSVLVRKLLNIYAKSDCCVYDPFMGTGTTAIGCIRNNLNFIGTEISPKYCAYANDRINKELSMPTLF